MTQELYNSIIKMAAKLDQAVTQEFVKQLEHEYGLDSMVSLDVLAKIRAAFHRCQIYGDAS